MKTIEQGIKEIMAILEGEDKGYGGEGQGQVAGGALNNSAISPISAISPVSAISTISPVPVRETVYDGRGHVVSENGRKSHTGYKKNAKRVKDEIRADIMDAAEALLAGTKAFEGKVGRNSVDGIVIRLSDADYTVKVVGHAKREFANREDDFVPTKSYLTRGKAENHSSAIAKIFVAEFGNQFSCASFCGFENGKTFTLLSATASGVRFEIGNSELTLKITKKRARVCMN